MSLSVLTLNLWHDAGPWKKRAELIRGWIDRLDPDLIGFQEVLRSEDVDLAAELIGARPYALDYVAASPFWRPGLSFGNAIASRWPILSREELRLPDHGDGETRAALSVSIDAPVGPIRFSCTHLNWKFHHGETRERQVVALCEQALRLRERGGFPPIMVGDFNAEPESDEIRYVTGLHSVDGRRVSFHDAWRVVGEGEGTSHANYVTGPDTATATTSAGGSIRNPNNRAVMSSQRNKYRITDLKRKRQR